MLIGVWFFWQLWNPMKYKKNWGWRGYAIATGTSNHRVRQRATAYTRDWHGWRRITSYEPAGTSPPSYCQHERHNLLQCCCVCSNGEWLACEDGSAKFLANATSDAHRYVCSYWFVVMYTKTLNQKQKLQWTWDRIEVFFFFFDFKPRQIVLWVDVPGRRIEQIKTRLFFSFCILFWSYTYKCLQ